MWTLFESNRVLREVTRMPMPVREKYDAWRDVVRLQGPEGLRELKGFHDEALRGVWAGYRSSRLGIQYRVIYSVNRDEVFVHVERVTAHDYRS